MPTPKRSKAQQVIQKSYLKDERNLNEEEFKKLRIKLDGKERILGNLKLSKRLFGGYSIKMVDSKKDLDGVLVSERKDLLKKLVSKWDNEIEEIEDDELKKLNIYPSEIYYKIGNFELERASFRDIYYLKLKDERKDSLGRWNDSEVNMKRVINSIKELENEPKSVKTEKQLQKLIFSKLNEEFHTVNTEVSIGDLKTTKIDIEVGKKIGVELKMAKSLLKSSEFNRTIGQVTHEYIKKYSNRDLLLIVGGNGDLRTSSQVKDLSKLIKKQKSHFYYLETL